MGSDHQLIIANICLKLKKTEKKCASRRFDVKLLKNEDISGRYCAAVQGRMGNIDREDDVETTWEKVKHSFNEASKDVLGFVKQTKSKDWMSNETYQLVDERKALKPSTVGNKELKKQYNFLCREIRRRCIKDKENYVNEICRKVEQAQIQKKSKEVYDGIKKLTDKKTTRSQLIKDKNGNLLTDPDMIKDRWAEHFKELYNPINPTDETVLDDIPSDYGLSQEDGSPEITRDEIRWAISNLKSGKAPGVDMISAEEIFAAGETGEMAFFELCRKIWVDEQLPEEWKRSVIIPIHKKKDKHLCDNYRGISLLCHSQKLLASIILRRIKGRTEEILSEAQAGFRRDRSTIDQLFALRLIAEKYSEHGKDIYVCFVDFQKAFDSVWRRGLWQAMRHLGYDNKLVRILESMYRGTCSAVRTGTKGELSGWFETLVGVLQGCVLSPILFNILLEVVMLLSLNEVDIGATISGFICNNLRFADDIALIAEREKDLQALVNKVHQTSARVGLIISKSKTEVESISRNPQVINIDIEGTPLMQRDQFVYLGGVISSDSSSEHDIKRRIGLATGASASLGSIWASKEISEETKVRVYKSLILSILLYNSETWTLKEVDKNRLRVFEMSILRRILGISMWDRWRNNDIRARLHLEQDVISMIQRRRLLYFGHANRMKEDRIPYIALHGRVHGTRPVGRPRRRWIDGIRDDCDDLGLSLHQAFNATADRSKWREMVDELPRRTHVSQRP